MSITQTIGLLALVFVNIVLFCAVIYLCCYEHKHLHDKFKAYENYINKILYDKENNKK